MRVYCIPEQWFPMEWNYLPGGNPEMCGKKKKASAGHNDWMAPVDRKTDLWHPAMIPKVEISHTNFVPLNLYN